MGAWRRSAALVLVLMVSLLPASGAVATHGSQPYQSFGPVTVDTGATGARATWQGTTATGANVAYDFDAGEPCFDPRDLSSDPLQRRYCDIGLLHVDLSADPDFWATQGGGGVQVRLSDYQPDPASDFDLQVFESDADGSRGPLVGSSGNFPGAPEQVVIPEADGHYLLQVAYFAVVESTYTGEVKFVTRGDDPPDVDDPPGLQASLASDPALGFRSHSEPHIAQSPLDPDLLVAASKQYNRDPDSLPEYEFKVGSYVSLDRGRTWTDLGQVAVCPADEAGPDTWPDNPCYPEEDPDLGGTGPEDVNDPDDPEDPHDPRGSGDFAEEYIVSDPWVHFDDEGNAYLMVLDAPPFETGRGWGMTLHRWDNVAAGDLASGETWSDRIVINAYDSGGEQELFLDDKNTFAVNNAGPDGDGETGIMIACWGQNIPDVIKQQIVCERSTDAGRSWPDDPTPISGAFPLVIGVHVVADPSDPARFYAVWLQYASGLLGPSTLEFAQTLDGGLTWTLPHTIAAFEDIPRQLPGQSFRNLSLPIMAVGPAGDLNVTFAQYNPTADPDDEDGRHADIMLVRSELMGLPGTWTEPVRVNQDTGRADQFQPHVAVNPAGQIEVTYFDRRHDQANFFIDTYLSRTSLDEAGALRPFTDVRLSHDMWDPTVNPPISTSGDFIGDYQGLVVDACFAIPFVNDTHLANDADRDPDFDAGLPRSEFQEVFSWLVPNRPEFGGDGAGCQPADEEVHVHGGGQVPGRDGQGVASFGLNVRGTPDDATGSVRWFDHGTGQHVRTVRIDSLTRSGDVVVVRGACRIDGATSQPCQVEAVDRGTPGAGGDELRLEVGTDYAGGAVLRHGNVTVE